MKINKKCPHCGASIKQWWQPLSPGLLLCLVKAIRVVKNRGVNRFHWHKDLELTNNESHNFQKLRFHGLIAHADENIKSGYWLITTRGGAFLRGQIEIPKRVLTFRNKVIDHSPEMVHIRDLKNKLPYFDDVFESEVRRDLVDNAQAVLTF